MDNKSREISLFFAVFCEALSSLEKGRPPGHGMVPPHNASIEGPDSPLQKGGKHWAQRVEKCRDAELVGWRPRRSRPNGRGDGRKKLVALQKTAKTALLGVCGALRRALARAVVVS